MKKFFLWFVVFGFLVGLISCTKSGALTGSTSPSSSGNLTGSVTGGLSPLAGALVSVYVAGSNSPIANATTTANGSYTLSYTNPGSGLLYLAATGGNAGSGANSKIQLMAVLGSGSSVPSSLLINEASTAAVETVAYNFNLLNDSNGTITINLPKNAAAAANVVTQYNNLITNSGTTAINSANPNVTTPQTNALYTMANAFASCIENSSNCTTLFNAAQSTTGSAAASLLESGMNMLINSSTVATPVYNVAFPLSTSTGYTLPSSSLPSSFTFNTGFAPSITILTPGLNAPNVVTFDASGNLWVPNSGGNTVAKLTPSGAILGTFTVGSTPRAIAIDASGNIWVTASGSNNVTELSSSGTTLGTFSVGSAPFGISIAPNGNVWIANSGGPSVSELTSSGTTVGTFTLPGGNNTRGIAIDNLGSAWVSSQGNNLAFRLNSNGVVLNTTSNVNSAECVNVDPSGNIWISGRFTGLAELNPSGIIINQIASSQAQPNSLGMAIDAAGDIWVSGLNSTISEYNPSGVNVGGTWSGINIAGYLLSGRSPQGVAIDAFGNVWIADSGSANALVEMIGVAQGPQFFPYSGPIFGTSF